MEKLVTAESALVSDPRNDLWRVPDPSAPDGYRAQTLDDIVAAMAPLELPEYVPEDIATAFAITRNLWIYGWFHYPFYTLAASRAYLCLEVAMRERWNRDNPGAAPKAEPRGLSRLLAVAVKQGWIHNEGLQAAEAARRRRSELAAALPAPFNLMFEGDGHPQGYVQNIAETLPSLRNSLAHEHSFWFPHTAEQHIRLVWELIIQVFDPDATSSTQPARP